MNWSHFIFINSSLLYSRSVFFFKINEMLLWLIIQFTFYSSDTEAVAVFVQNNSNRTFQTLKIWEHLIFISQTIQASYYHPRNLSVYFHTDKTVDLVLHHFHLRREFQGPCAQEGPVIVSVNIWWSVLFGDRLEQMWTCPLTLILF